MTTTTVVITEADKGLPDASLTYDGETYTLVITGLTGLIELPRFIRSDEEDRGIVSLQPPTVSSTDYIHLPGIMLQALEIVTPPSLLAVEEAEGPSNDPTQVMLAHLARLVSRLMWKLEPPS